MRYKSKGIGWKLFAVGIFEVHGAIDKMLWLARLTRAETRPVGSVPLSCDTLSTSRVSALSDKSTLPTGPCFRL